MNRTLKLLVSLLASFALLGGIASAASSPTVSTKPPSSVTTSSAVLRGAVNPNGAKTAYAFQWGLSTAYGSSSRFHTVTGSKSVNVSLKVTHLLPGTTYHFRIVALNRVGGVTGSDRTFKTKGSPPPYAATGPATGVTTNSATVTGVVNPNNVQTTWYFEYGLSTAYGQRTDPQTVPAGKSPVAVSRQLLALQSGTVFHYRLVAVNRGVTRFGADAMFMTFPVHPPKATVHYRIRPHVDRSQPYVYNVTGHISGPSSIPSQFACSKTVTVSFFFGKRRVHRTKTLVQPDCSFTAQTVFNRHPRRTHGQIRLRVTVKFSGNGYLAHNHARPTHVRLG
jgi:hypothetical protein